jgi:hypothetical protein
VLGAVSNASAKIELDASAANQAAGQPATPLYTLAIQNGAGEYIAPTPDNMTKAASLGGGQPLYGLNESVPGAYPLTFVDDIYVPTKGLSVEKMNAIATLMRYQAIEGQDVETTLGEGKLPASLLQQTVSAADEVIKDNCTGDGQEVHTVQGGGPFWPANDPSAPQTSLLCVGSAATGTAPTSGASGGTSADDALISGGSASSDLGAVAADATSSNGVSTTPSSAGGSVETASGASPARASSKDEAVRVASAKMPSSLPSDGQFGLDRLTTLLLGAAAFFVVRRMVAKGQPQ